LLLITVIAVAAGAATVFFLHGQSVRRSAPPPRRSHAPAARRRVATPAQAQRPLLSWPPLSQRRFLRPVAARGAIVVDAKSGRVLWALHPRRRLPVASTTKIMTAFLALEQLRPEATVTVTPAAARVPLVREGLRPRERVRAWKLLEGLLIYSGNDDALALAVATAKTRSAFVARMNREAAHLGLRDTHFSTPSGVIDRANFSTAADLAALTRVALRNGRFRSIVRTRIAHVPWSAPTFEKVYVNKNALLGNFPGADGVKTGWTTLAGHCLVASATRRGRTIIAVLLNDPQDYPDAKRLLDLGFATRV
jgi:D-alanyl-D-alanine carboxypeptidase